MANYKTDSRIVLTLDAGGTNMVFSAMRGGEYIIDPITLPSNAKNLDLCLQTLVLGFSTVIDKLEEKPVAISFAFPGPADYPHGIIGGYLPNFPSFRDGVALGPFLEDKFGIPVYINNDGDLYAYGEALGGALPEVNARLEAAGSDKRFHNLIGYTFGTGLGIGFVMNGELNRGDNSCVETFCLPNFKMPGYILEDSASIRAVTRVYGEASGNLSHGLTPKEIAEICHGEREGNREAAIKAFNDILKPLGIKKCGIRLDSGDIAYLSRKARKMLDEAGWENCTITVSNSLDEYLIQDLWMQDAKIDAFGVGERLITAKSEPVFGCVYKLVAVEDKDGNVTPKIKISENVGKITTPHFKKLYRFYGRDTGKAIADYLTVYDETVDDSKNLEIFDPDATWKRKEVYHFEARELLVPIYQKGKLVYKRPSVEEIKTYCAEQVDTLWDEVKRFDNPHNYYVDLSQKLYDIKTRLLNEKNERREQN